MFIFFSILSFIALAALANKFIKKKDYRASNLILDDQGNQRLYHILSIIFFLGGCISIIAYFLAPVLYKQRDIRPTIYSGIWLFVFSIAMFLIQLMKVEEKRNSYALAISVVSIPIITLKFVDVGGVTVWVFPLLLILLALVYNTRVPLILYTVSAVFTQLVIWIYVPNQIVHINHMDYVGRIGIFMIVYFLGSFINKTYIDRLQENIHQIDFQKLMYEISYDFVSMDLTNMEDKIKNMLSKMGLFFEVDHIYVVLIEVDKNIMTYSYEWFNEKVCLKRDIKHKIHLEKFPWWMSQLKNNKQIYIDDLDNIPGEAWAEKAILTKQGIKSAVVIPIEENEQIQGFIGLNSIILKKQWSKDEIGLIKILLNLLADGLIKAEKEKEIEYMAFYDQLTNLPNRMLFAKRLSKELQIAKTNGGYLSVIFINLDSFKVVNDTIGHSGGDTILIALARALEAKARESDTVARFAGDEFLVLANDISEPHDVEKFVSNLMQIFENPFYVRDQEFFITCSIGVAVYPFDGDDVDTLIKNAGIAMYSAKEKGKNCYALCTEDMKQDIERNIMISNSLYRAEERDELIIYYQPQVDPCKNTIIGLEALLRWNHTKLGMIPPSTFIPLAEINGTINSIGEWVLRTAINQNKKWQDMGFSPMRIAVNLSVVQLNNPHFVDMVAQILEESGLEPKYLELEITENIATQEVGRVIKILNKLKELGVSISIDDFGTEYSSLNRLKHLPIDRIKIDMQFVQGIGNSEKDQAITKVIISLAKNLGLGVIAEGVETEPQLEFLNQRMCDEVQGYYYYKPMPAEEIEEILRTRHLTY